MPRSFCFCLPETPSRSADRIQKRISPFWSESFSSSALFLPGFSMPESATAGSLADFLQALCISPSSGWSRCCSEAIRESFAGCCTTQARLQRLFSAVGLDSHAEKEIPPPRSGAHASAKEPYQDKLIQKSVRMSSLKACSSLRENPSKVLRKISACLVLCI